MLLMANSYRVCGSYIPHSGSFSGVQIFVKSCRGSSELIFVVLNFVTPEARYANGRKISWVENFVTRRIVTKITKISNPPPENYPLYGVYIYI